MKHRSTINITIIILTREQGCFANYHPPTKLWEGNVSIGHIPKGTVQKTYREEQKKFYNMLAF